MMKISGLSAPVEWHCLFSVGDRRYAFLFRSDCINLLRFAVLSDFNFGWPTNLKEEDASSIFTSGNALIRRASHVEHLKIFSCCFKGIVYDKIGLRQVIFVEESKHLSSSITDKYTHCKRCQYDLDHMIFAFSPTDPNIRYHNVCLHTWTFINPN